MQQSTRTDVEQPWIPAAEYKAMLSRIAEEHRAITQWSRARIMRELEELERNLLSDTWAERRERFAVAGSAMRDFASFRDRLNAVHYAKRAVAPGNSVATFLTFVLENLRLQREAELDMLVTCFPLLEALNEAEHTAMLHAHVSGPSQAFRLAIYENTRILDQREQHLRALEIGRHSAVWSASRDELLALMRALDI